MGTCLLTLTGKLSAKMSACASDRELARHAFVLMRFGFAASFVR
jgi:hypothetical protein